MPKVRRKFFVSKRLQGFFALYLSLTIVVMSLFLGMEFLRSYFAVFGWQMGEGGSLKIPFISEASPFSEPFAEIDVLSLIKVVLLLLWGALCVGISYILAANKFAGPIYRLNMVLRKVGAGDFTIRTKFRTRDDAFHSVAENFNHMMDTVQNSVKQDLKYCDAFEQTLKQIKQNLPVASKNEAEQLSQQFQQWKTEKQKLVTPQNAV